MSDIRSKQTQERLVRHVAAARQLYAEDKHCGNVWSLVSLAVFLLGTGVLAFVGPFTALISIATLVIAVGESLVLRFIERKRRLAACIQEEYDCELFDLPWNSTLCPRPSQAAVKNASTKYLAQASDREKKRVTDWYEGDELDTLPIEQARLACQRQNVWWDKTLRRGFSKLALNAVIGAMTVLLLAGCLADWSVRELLSGPFILAFPVMGYALHLWYAHDQAVQRLQDLEGQIDGLLESAASQGVDPQVLTERSREIQNEIFHSREQNPPVVDWYYKKRRPEMTAAE